MNPTFADLTEELHDSLKPPLLRDEVPEHFWNLTPIQQHFRIHGYVILRDYIDHDIIDSYCDRFMKDRGDKATPIRSGAWRANVPYMEVPEIRDLCCGKGLANVLGSLIGYEMGLHLNLIEWTSTERDWHADDYLNPEHVNNHYLAVWTALDDIHPDSGPFEFIDGSHQWPLMRRSKVFDAAPNDMKALPNWHTDWPSLTQGFVSAAVEDEIRARGSEVSRFIPASKGDILIWSGSLIHRGSYPKVRGTERKALISHYSSIQHRRDMPYALRHNNEGIYFSL